MAWTDVLALADLSDGDRKVVQVGDREVVLVNHKGKVYAVGSRCPHMGAQLRRGRITEDGKLICPWHHSSFSLETGAVSGWTPWPPVLGRLLGLLRRHRPLPVYTTKTEQGRIWVELD